MKVDLVLPDESLEEAYWNYASDVESDGSDRHVARAREIGFAAVLEERRRMAVEENIPVHLVPITYFWLVDEAGVIHGELRLRHRLNPSLLDEGGHIGYSIRPSSRRRGYGTKALELGLVKAKEKGIDRVLVTCDDDNIGSIGVIENNGGGEFERGISEWSGKLIRRYWIPNP